LTCSSPPHNFLPLCFFHTHFVPIGLQFGGGSTNSHTWFLSKFSNSSCMAFTQLGSDRACLYRDSRKTKLPLLHNIRIHAPEGHFVNSRHSSIGRMPDDRTSLSLDASLAIPMRVLSFEAYRLPRVPSPPAEPPVLVL
jgi:hypothetical protein